MSMNKTSVQVSKDLISISEAVGMVLDSVKPLPSMKVMLQGSKNYRLSQPVYADMDAPSFDRAMMDGYALKASTSGEGVEIEIVGEIAAGKPRSESVPGGKAVKIMTGAPMPEGADAVIEVELTEVVGGNKVRLNAGVKPGKNIAFKGEEMKSGQEILKTGTFIDAPVAAVLAMAGKSMVDVYSLPRIGILVTGTELIDPGNPLKPGQIRETNTFSLTAQSLIWGGIPIRLGKAGDDPESLKAGIHRGFEYEIFTITGGVSMGDYDLVPDILREMGVEVLFHKVAQKPGKPILYGKKGSTHIFGLPGNPVAVFIGFELYVGPLIRQLAGEGNFQTKWHKGVSTAEFKVNGDRTIFKPAIVEPVDGLWKVQPVPSHGSADIYSIVGTNAFAKFKEGKYSVPEGTEVEFFFHRGKPYGA